MQPNHNYQQYAGQTLNWLPSDTEERFQRNLSTHPELLSAAGWDVASIRYEFNAQGFRSPKFRDTGGVMFLGCSYTCGVGLPIQDVWCNRVADELGLDWYNLGIGGSSNDTAFRLGNFWIPELKPSLVVLLSPMHNRLEITNHLGDIWDVNVVGYDFQGPWDLYAQWVSNDVNGETQRLRNIMALELVCVRSNCALVSLNIEDVMAACKEPNDWARDLDHHGKSTHQNIARYVLDRI